MTTSFRYDKEMLFKEFVDAKQKDIKLGKGDDQKTYTNRIKYLKEMIDLEAEMPEVFEFVKINFKRLLDSCEHWGNEGLHRPHSRELTLRRTPDTWSAFETQFQSQFLVLSPGPRSPE